MTTQSETPRCKSTVYQPQGFGRFYPCSFKAWKDGYCKIHHPDTVKARREKQEKKYEEERAKSPYVLLQKATERNKELEREVTALTAKISEQSMAIELACNVCEMNSKKIADLTAQLAEARRDAERYRWLIGCGYIFEKGDEAFSDIQTEPVAIWLKQGQGCQDIEIDAAIDAAMKEPK